MKTIKKLSLLGLIMVASILPSCSKKNPDPVVAASNGLITCKVNGAAFTTAPIAGQSAPIIIATKIAIGGQNLISITGQSAANITATGGSAAGSFDSITISLNGISAPGTYPVNSDITLGYIYSTPNPGSAIAKSTGYVTGNCSGTKGTITVTSLTATTIEGTFSFTAKKESTCDDTKTITDGAFKVTFMN